MLNEEIDGIGIVKDCRSLRPARLRDQQHHLIVQSGLGLCDLRVVDRLDSEVALVRTLVVGLLSREAPELAKPHPSSLGGVRYAFVLLLFASDEFRLSRLGLGFCLGQFRQCEIDAAELPVPSQPLGLAGIFRAPKHRRIFKRFTHSIDFSCVLGAKSAEGHQRSSLVTHCKDFRESQKLEPVLRIASLAIPKTRQPYASVPACNDSVRTCDELGVRGAPQQIALEFVNRNFWCAILFVKPAQHTPCKYCRADQNSSTGLQLRIASRRREGRSRYSVAQRWTHLHVMPVGVLETQSLKRHHFGKAHRTIEVCETDGCQRDERRNLPRKNERQFAQHLLVVPPSLGLPAVLADVWRQYSVRD